MTNATATTVKRAFQTALGVTAILIPTRPGGAAPIDPSTVPGLVGWYDAQTLTGADGTGLTSWTDKTGGTNTDADDLSQVTQIQ